MKRVILPLLCLSLIAGCAHVQPNYTLSLEGSAARLARPLARDIDEDHRGMTVIVAVPVETTSLKGGRLGLALQELLVTELVSRDQNVLETQLRVEPYITCRDGLVALSRDASRLKNGFRASIIVVSTYTVKDSTVTVSSRAVEYETNDIIASATTTLVKTGDVAELLGPGERRLYEH